MRKLLLLSLLLGVARMIHGQSPAAYTILLKDKKVYKAVVQDIKDSSFALDAPVDTLIIEFPTTNIANYTLQFNSRDSAHRFTLAFDIDADDNKKNIVALPYTALQNGKIKLVFKDSDLVQVLGRPDMIKGRALSRDKKGVAYVKVLSKNSKPDTKKDTTLTVYDSLKTSVRQNFIAIESSLIHNSYYFCDTIVCKDCQSGTRDGGYYLPRSPFSLDVRKGEPHTGHRLVYDLRTPRKEAIYWRFEEAGKAEKATGIIGHYVQEDPAFLRTNRNVTVYVVGFADSSYTVNTTSLDFFMEDSASFAKLFNGIVAPAPSTTASAPANPGNKPGTGGTHAGDSTAVGVTTPQQLLNISAPKKEALKLFSDSSFPVTLTALAFNKKISLINSLSNAPVTFSPLRIQPADSAGFIELESKYGLANSAFTSYLTHSKDLAYTLSSKGKKDSVKVDTLLKKLDSLTKVITIMATTKTDTNSVSRLLAELISLKIALEDLNTRYSSIDFRKYEYRYALACLKKAIERGFNIPTPDDPNEMASRLISRVKPFLPEMYYDEFKYHIKAIADQYKLAGDKQAVFYTAYTTKNVPNKDLLFLHISSKSGATMYADTFHTVWGLKIDFSTGIFVNGINSTEYILGSHTFRYRETRNFTNQSGGDSIVYTGRDLDTTGNLIQKNRHAFNYSTGFLVHIYPRTGRGTAVGGVAGITFNNSNLMGLLGISTMFSVGAARFSIAGGFAFGKQKSLSSDERRFVWNKTTDPDERTRIYNSVYEVPRFFTSGNISTYDKLQTSWFVGVTYNFSSINVGK